MGLLVGFQGSNVEVVVEDYELLLEMINNAEKYVR